MRRICSDQDNMWTPELLGEVYETIEDIAVKENGYDVYSNQIEIVTFEGMLEAYASVGMPMMYPHWSFGKHYLQTAQDYKAGLMGLAYEIVINSNPCISYLMEGNTLTMQALVIAHAAFGHNHFFKNNYLYKQWTNPELIIPYISYARRYITLCEEKHGIERVEAILDAAHAVSYYSVDKYARVNKTKKQLEEDMKKQVEWEDSQFNPLAAGFKDEKHELVKKDLDYPPVEETDNLLYFIERHSPSLYDWERELIKVVRLISQYFYPQRLTQLMNEGFATSTHADIVHTLEARGLVDERFMLEFVDKHSGVLGQQRVSRGNNLRQLSVYKLGYTMYMDIKRRCEHPTKEDEYYFPEQVERPFRDVWFEAVRGYKDESFILQYLSPEVVRNMGLMSMVDSTADEYFYTVSGVSDDDNFKRMRKTLSLQYDPEFHLPQISVYDVDWKTDRTLKLRYKMQQGRRPLHEKDTLDVLAHIHQLWKFPVYLETQNPGKGGYLNSVRFPS